MELEGKIAIVTAAGRGIGRVIALCLAEGGANVVINSSHEEATAKVAAEVEASGRQALPMAGDITEIDMITQVVENTLNKFVRIDILVNNVGGSSLTRREPDDSLLGRAGGRMGWHVSTES